MRWALDRGVVFRALESIVSTVENRTDALDASDVATGVVAIRDQGGASGDFQVCSPTVFSIAAPSPPPKDAER